MEKKYIHNDIEQKIYLLWEESNSFIASDDLDNKKDTFSIMIPPPNVTGSLHMGHALNNTLQDILIRYRRMLGDDTLWQPGTDHAGIATQMVVEKKLFDDSKKTKEDLGRKRFIEEIWRWKGESGDHIINQLKRLGSSCDWSRERFTLDEGLSKAVTHVFNKLYEDGLVYKDKRLVNWDPKFKTAISDLEVQQIETEGNLWYIEYDIINENDKITVATTRPETMLGDTAIAVNPNDQDKKHLIGKMANIPLANRQIPIIADDYAKLEEGTGAVKITPAHDFNDFEVGKRNNLEMINVFDKDAKIIDDSVIPKKYRNLDRFDARKIIIKDLEACNALKKVEKHIHTIPHGDRSGVVIEPYLTDQWYVNAKKLSIKAIEAVKKEKTRFVPANWQKTYYEWMDNIQPWCISRQLWWGHQIPVWYGPDDTYFVAMDDKDAHNKAKKHYGKDVELQREEDVLDTWFSSALWPFSTLGWPENTNELQKYYPTSVLVTGFDIIFFWVARMMMMALYLTDSIPFHTIYIHALVRDEKGQKMSKSKGNVIDPLELIKKYGADSLRFTLSSMAAQGRDIKLSESRVEGYRNFITKIWNVARFINTNDLFISKDFSPTDVKYEMNIWILQDLDTLNKKITNALDNYKFNEASNELYKFIWHVYCDWYIEIIKDDITQISSSRHNETKDTLIYSYIYLLKICHPFIPFVTEEINQIFNNKDLVVTSSWPKPLKFKKNNAKDSIDFFINLISEIRSLRSELNVSPSIKPTLLVLKSENIAYDFLSKNINIFNRMARLSDIKIVDQFSTGLVKFNVEDMSFGLNLKEIINIDQEIDRLNKEINACKNDMSVVQNKLNNDKFINNAPSEIIDKQRNLESELKKHLEELMDALDRIQNIV
tara:strand:- start:1553 stop:4204 length:2652 start_codon:yes stop_codon:yes gene_type:complete